MGGVPHVMAGRIVSSGFASGDRVVVGHWWRSPIGPFTDVMWAGPDGIRLLFAPDDRVARYVTTVYRFDRLEVVPFETASTPRRLQVRFGDRTFTAEAGRGVPIPGPRPRWLTRWVERPIARALLGVRTFGVSPSGVREWYQADRWQPLRSARATSGADDLGPMAPVDPPCGFGFSEPPRRPSMVSLRTVLEDPAGRLDSVIRG